ncbi:hypothetical protein [Hymenobacter sp. BT491]|uniref:hypothetical protein n=1 Tax=Hymenobacter sp. BT491 TaxID=2766779 RepID=UPI001653E6AE|nr:hypothetical protein [Hymenobacter sp. BT491]MBC6991482.1 hypothetical protein [Hymenobacter sp. BT491]
MQALRSHLALLLLLCFVRVLLPDTWVLALHWHRHTTEEPAQNARRHSSKGKALLTAKHQHCGTNHFYNAAFQAAPPLELRFFAQYAPLAPITAKSVWLTTAASASYLRGPPARS